LQEDFICEEWSKPLNDGVLCAIKVACSV